MTQDLTKITTPFGLLDAETQKALKECGGPWQKFGNDGWGDVPAPRWFDWMTYRKKPTPREYVVWLVCQSGGNKFGVFYNEINAYDHAKNIGGFVVKLTGTRDE